MTRVELYHLLLAFAAAMPYHAAGMPHDACMHGMVYHTSPFVLHVFGWQALNDYDNAGAKLDTHAYALSTP
jgi:hypothetical protein